eukprot:6196905-Pleurochrysis_carterae.AAC.2
MLRALACTQSVCAPVRTSASMPRQKAALRSGTRTTTGCDAAMASMGDKSPRASAQSVTQNRSGGAVVRGDGGSGSRAGGRPTYAARPHAAATAPTATAETAFERRSPVSTVMGGGGGGGGNGASGAA